MLRDDLPDDNDNLELTYKNTEEFANLCAIARQHDVHRLLLAIQEAWNNHEELYSLVQFDKLVVPLLAYKMAEEEDELGIQTVCDLFHDQRLAADGLLQFYFKHKRYDDVLIFLQRMHESRNQFMNFNHAGKLAILGFIANDDIDQITHLLNSLPQLAKTAQFHLAEYSHCQAAEDLQQRGGTVTNLIHGYAVGGNYSKVNQLIEHRNINQRRRNREVAIEGFYTAEHFQDDDKALLILAHIDSDATRKHLFFARGYEPYHYYRLPLAKHVGIDFYHYATKLNRIMREYQINFTQAQTLEIPGVREFILQGRQQGTNLGTLPPDLYFMQLANMTGLSTDDAKGLYQAVCHRTYELARNTILSPNTFFAKRYTNNGIVRAARQKRQLEALDERYDESKRRRF